MESTQEKTIVALYDDFVEAQRTVQDLVDNGFQRNNISIVANDAEGEYADYMAQTDIDDDVSAAEGAGFGAIVGGLTGLLVSLTALAIPGIGPVLVAGPIAATLIGAGVGAVTGGIVGALVDLGVPEDEAGYYAEGVRRGGTLVTVTTSEHMSQRAIEIMDSHDPIDVEERVASWRESGWTSYDPNAESYKGRDWVSDAGVDTNPTYTTPTFDREGTLNRDFDAYSEDFRTHFNSYYANTGYTYDQYMPAYRYGYYLANDARYYGGDWDLIEPEARRYWETNEQGAWEDFKDAVRHAWEETKDTARDAWQETKDTARDMGRSVSRTFDSYDNDFHTHYNTYYTNTGYTYDQYLPAYRYGYTLANDRNYYDRDWDLIEPEARRYWETNEQGAWEDFKDAVHHAWHRTKQALGVEDRDHTTY